jgi:acyl-CoA thioester hydrolase
MLENTMKFRVRYAETDQMGIVHHANYPVYYEMGRTEMFRNIGLPYDEMERRGIILPLIDLHCNYKRSAYYDQELTLITQLRELPSIKIRFDYIIKNSEGEILNEGYTTLVFMDSERRRPIRVPADIEEELKQYFQK